jgi:hypothetical protein
MSEAKPVLEIDRPNFTVKLYENMLKIDLKGSVKNNIEQALENKPILKQTLGNILGMFAPLHIHLSDIEKVQTDDKGNIKLIRHFHRDVTIPLEQKDAQKLAKKLNELIPEEKNREINRILREQKTQRTDDSERELAKEETFYPISGSVGVGSEPPGVREEEKEAAEDPEYQD